MLITLWGQRADFITFLFIQGEKLKIDKNDKSDFIEKTNGF